MKRIERIGLTGLAALASLTLSGPDLAIAGPGTHAEVDVLPGWRQSDGNHMAALRISLDEGWKTYWRAPGEAGIPPQVNWSGSENIASVGFHWPIPEIIVSNGVTTLGYSGEVILPFEVTATDPGADIAITGVLAFGICEDVCMPLEAEVSAVLPAAVSEQSADIVTALAARPNTAADAEVMSSHCAVEEITDGMRVTARFEMPPVGAEEFLVMEPDDRSIWVSEAMLARDGNVLIAEADLVPPEAKPFDLDVDTLRFTVLTHGAGVDIRGCTALN